MGAATSIGRWARHQREVCTPRTYVVFSGNLRAVTPASSAKRGHLGGFRGDRITSVETESARRRALGGAPVSGPARQT